MNVENRVKERGIGRWRDSEGSMMRSADGEDFEFRREKSVSFESRVSEERSVSTSWGSDGERRTVMVRVRKDRSEQSWLGLGSGGNQEEIRVERRRE